MVEEAADEILVRALFKFLDVPGGKQHLIDKIVTFS
jgi:hypothetical protein